MTIKDESLVKRIATVIGLSESDFKLVCNHANTSCVIYKLTDKHTGQMFALKMDKRRGKKVRAEVEYLRANNDLVFLPHVYQAGTVDFRDFYLMEYLEGYRSFTDLYQHNCLTPGHIQQVVEVLGNIQTTIESKSVVHKIYEEHYVGRLNKRLQTLRESFLHQYLESQSLRINASVFENLTFFWERRLQGHRDSFFTETGPYPGDTHFENVLINNNQQLKIIDPNGAMFLPLAYDIGKLLHSLHGGYDVFHAASFRVRQRAARTFAFSYQFPERRDELLRVLIKSILQRWGAKVLQVSYLSEIFHFSSLISHHLCNKKEALGFYLRTLELIDEYKKAYSDA
ncbi:MAG: hypothetical protein QOF62_1975 [Pyrinomonadaceae bacterium]|jgi:hypothetical protein|nr:hypothetical protein [Pyrinomonadaceae bacterium]